MAHLLSELRLRDVVLPNRIGVSPMCQYSCEDGLANDWHFVHLGTRAVGGAGLILTEAAAVTPEGRITPHDLGVWSEAHFEPLQRITRFIDAHGSIAGIQLAHAGRKASTHRPWSGKGAVSLADGGWRPIGPSPVSFSQSYSPPREMSVSEIHELRDAFAVAAERSYHAGFRIIEIHAAHGYLMHEFLSPLSNQRGDEYGGSFENRTRFLRETAAAVRKVLPERCPLFVRISATDWTDGGWDVDQSVELSRELKALGADLIDVSSGGQYRNRHDARRPRLPDRLRRAYQARSGYRHVDRRHDHLGCAGRPCGTDRPGRPCASGTRAAAQSLLALARRPGAWPSDALARAISARRPGRQHGAHARARNRLRIPAVYKR